MVRAYIKQGLDTDSRTFWFGFGISATCHLILFAALIFSPNLRPKRTFSPAVINVSMVSLADLGIAPSSAGPTLSQPSKAVSGASKKWKTKKSLKKQTYKRSKLVKKAEPRTEKKIEEKPPERLIEAIDRVGEEVAKTRPVDQEVTKTQPVDRTVDKPVMDVPHQGAGVPGVQSGSGTGGKKELEVIDIYRIFIATDIQKNWAFSPLMAKGQTDLEALISFKVMPNGQIRDIQLDKRSGNRYLDESAKKAILKSNPVQPHPPGINKPYIMVGLRATPKGLN
ncbi:energy transducer TonB [Thermodesulfobacteriota bacterium]